MENHLLSKSTFQRGLQCQKSLYLYKNFVQLRDRLSTEQKSIFNRGNKVGLLAQKLFPGGIDVSQMIKQKNEHRYQRMIEKTRELIASGCEVIYEAAFQHERVLIILDILVKRDNEWYAYEVKSSTRVTQTYITDISLQYWVITKSGIPLKDAAIIIINNQYVRKGKLNLNELFSTRSLIHEVMNNTEVIGQHISNLKNTVQQAQMPNINIGEHCFIPYNCDFRGTCWKNIPKDSVFELSGVPKSALFEIYNAGYTTIDKIPEENTLNENANIHIKALKRKEKIINKEGIKLFLEQIHYPVSFLDFEIFMPAIPLYNNTKPYQNLPFQYSLHIKKDKNSSPEHLYFLAEQGIDPRKAFIEHLLNNIPKQGSVVVYDTLMENNILNSLKQEFPELKLAIENITNRWVDLMKPFSEKLYYQTEMNNSFSIKNVLQALIPDLSYNNLAIPNGSIAMTSYEGLQSQDDFLKILETRENLLKYCELDTLAMIKLIDVLYKAVE